MAVGDFPNFNIPGYPYPNMPAQFIGSMQQPQGLPSYGRFTIPQQLAQQQDDTTRLGIAVDNTPNLGIGSDPWNFQANFGAIPSIPNVPLNNAQFQIPYGNSGLDRAMAAFAAKNPNSGFAQMVNNRLQSFTPGSFNTVAQTNPRLALTMLEQGGQNYENQVMAQNGWNQAQMNSWINGTFYGPGDPHTGLSPQNIAYLRSLGAK